MARTKKYLTSSKTSGSSVGFYRPLRRIQRSDVEDEVYHKPHRGLDRSPSTTELEELERQIAKAQQLKQELVQSLRERNRIVPSRPVYEEDDDEKELSLPQRVRSTCPPSPLANRKTMPKVSVTEDDDDDIDYAHHDADEKVLLLQRELQNALKRENEFKQELRELKDMLTKEHKEVDHTLHSLQKEAAGKEAIEKNRFSSISKELQEVVSAMNQLVTSETAASSSTAPVAAAAPPISSPTPIPGTAAQPTLPVDQVTPATPNPSPVTATVTPAAPTVTANTAPTAGEQPQAQTTTEPAAPVVTPTSPVPAAATAVASTQPLSQAIPPQTTKKKFPIPKPIIILVSVILFVALSAGSFWYFVNRKTEVNSVLVQEYMQKDPKNAQPAVEKKINESSSETKSSEATHSSASNPQPETKGVSDDKYKESQANIPFDQTEWDTLSDGVWGIELKYPKNAVNVIKTENNLTFIRKTGYIFKVQVVETALELKEYWKLIQASSLKYKVKETKFKDKDALFLELEDFANYPGDRYIVKVNDKIYDIWYATYSTTLSDEDAKRIDVMLDTFKFSK